MPLCKQPASSFVAEAGNIWNIREGWLANAADDLLTQPAGGPKRYVGLDMTNDDGLLQNVMHDCSTDCDGPGDRYTANSSGRIKDYGQVGGGIDPCDDALSIRIITQSTPWPGSQCVDDAVLWWQENHIDRDGIIAPLAGLSPDCPLFLDFSPTTPYPDNCEGPLVAGPYGPSECFGDCIDPDATDSFLFAIGMSGFFLKIFPEQGTIALNIWGALSPQGPVQPLTRLGQNYPGKGWLCCTSFPLTLPLTEYNGPPAHPEFPDADPRRYAGSYVLNNSAFGAITSAIVILSVL